MLQSELLFLIQKFHVATIAGPPARIKILCIVDLTASACLDESGAGRISTDVRVNEEEGDVARSKRLWYRGVARAWSRLEGFEAYDLEGLGIAGCYEGGVFAIAVGGGKGEGKGWCSRSEED